MVMAGAGFETPTILNWLLRAGDEREPLSAYSNLSWRRSSSALGPRGGLKVVLAADGLFVECKSCVHSASTLPGGVALAFLGLTEVEAVR